MLRSTTGGLRDLRPLLVSWECMLLSRVRDETKEEYNHTLKSSKRTFIRVVNLWWQ